MKFSESNNQNLPPNLLHSKSVKIIRQRKRERKRERERERERERDRDR